MRPRRTLLWTAIPRADIAVEPRLSTEGLTTIGIRMGRISAISLDQTGTVSVLALSVIITAVVPGNVVAALAGAVSSAEVGGAQAQRCAILHGRASVSGADGLVFAEGRERARFEVLGRGVYGHFSAFDAEGAFGDAGPGSVIVHVIVGTIQLEDWRSAIIITLWLLEVPREYR